jgi:hypothetical protein
MVLVHEFRIPMPMTTAEYQIGQLFSIAEMSKEGSGKGGEGVEVRRNEPFENESGKGQFTEKIYHVGSSLPSFVSMILPAKMLDVYESSWNSWPTCKTQITCPLLGDRFSLTILSSYLDNDNGKSANALNLAKDKLAKRKVVTLDIAHDENDVYRREEDPRLFKSETTGRGLLTEKSWETKCAPIMWCYKAVIVECKIWGLQSKIENRIMEFERNLFLRLHKRVFCSIDRWYALSMDEVRAIESQTEKELHRLFGGTEAGNMTGPGADVSKVVLEVPSALIESESEVVA